MRGRVATEPQALVSRPAHACLQGVHHCVVGQAAHAEAVRGDVDGLVAEDAQHCVLVAGGQPLVLAAQLVLHKQAAGRLCPAGWQGGRWGRHGSWGWRADCRSRGRHRCWGSMCWGVGGWQHASGCCCLQQNHVMSNRWVWECARWRPNCRKCRACMVPAALT